MGVFVRPVIAPRDGRTLDDAAFRALAIEIARGGVGDPALHTRDEDSDAWNEPITWVVPPFEVFVGPSACRVPLWGLPEATLGIVEPGVSRLWRGDDIVGLDAALQRAVTLGEDLWVRYADLERDNPEMRNADGSTFLGLRRTHAPVTLKASNEYLEPEELPGPPPDSVAALVWFEGDSKAAPTAEDLLKTPLGRALERAFGSNLYTATSYM